MPDEQPKSRPEPATPTPSVYGGEWGGSGKQNPRDKGEKDRPAPIKTPPEPQGSSEQGGPSTDGDF